MLNFYSTTRAIEIKRNKVWRNLSKNSIVTQLKIKYMSIAIVTKDDLQEFKMELLQEIKKLVQQGENSNSKKWLKSKEVAKLLNISPGTLQNLRISGTLTYTKIGGTLYYDNTEIEKCLNTNKVFAQPTLFK
jgi:hypothetical protein